MKKLLSLLLAFLMLMGMMAIPTLAADDVSVYLFGEKLEFDVPAQIVNGRTLVPVRKIFEELGYTVDWNNDTRTAIAVSAERTIRITIDSYTMYVNDEAKALDVPACIIDGRTLVPARAISEASGYKVDWDGDTRSVLITQPVKSVGPYKELKELILKEGTYLEDSNAYTIEYEVDQDFVGVGYNVAKEYITVAYVGMNQYGHYYVITIVLNEEENHVVIFSYPFEDGSTGVMYGEYSTPGEPYTITSTNLDEENLKAAKDITDEIIEFYLDPVLNEVSGFSLADFGIVY